MEKVLIPGLCVPAAFYVGRWDLFRKREINPVRGIVYIALQCAL